MASNWHLLPPKVIKEEAQAVIDLWVKKNEFLRSLQPLEELQRKAIKARRKDIFTQEDIDYAKARARQTVERLKSE